MELFPAADEQQLAFIKRVIDDCDYYLLIIGGRYGSVDKTGASYTEQEYDYAVEKGLKVIALLHKNPQEIPLGKSEQNPEGREKLKKFRNKVAAGRLVKFWEIPDELPGLVAINLLHAINTYPATGWVRANKIASEEMLRQTIELSKANEKLKALLAEAKPVPAFNDLAGLDEEVKANGTYWNKDYHEFREWSIKTSWKTIFAYVSPYLTQFPNDNAVKEVLTKALIQDFSRKSGSPRDAQYDQLDDQFFQTIAVQLSALKLVKREYLKATNGTMGVFWSLTPAGEHRMLEIRTVRTKKTTAGDNST